MLGVVVSGGTLQVTPRGQSYPSHGWYRIASYPSQPPSALALVELVACLPTWLAVGHSGLEQSERLGKLAVCLAKQKADQESCGVTT